MKTHAMFGPGGNGEAFAAAGKKSSLEAPGWLREIGLDAYEYEAGNGLRTSPAVLCALGEEAERQGIRMSLHAPYFISLSGVEPEKRLKSVGYIKESIEAAKLLRANIIVVHTGSAAKISREEALSLAADTVYRTLCEIGETDILIGLETMGKINQLGTLEEVISLCRMDKRLAPVVDFGHMNARELGTRFTDEDSYRYVFDTIGESLGDGVAKNLHCHFSRIEYTAGGEKKHLCFRDDAPFGPDYLPLMRVIAKEKLCPTVISESAGTQSEDALTMKQAYLSFLNEE